MSPRSPPWPSGTGASCTSTTTGMIAEITAFNADLFPAFGLRPAL
jgi:hypothetical protein